MLADCLRHRHEDHADFLQLFLEGRRDRDRIEHRIDRDAPLALGAHDAGEDLLFAQRNAELLICLENFRIDFIERGQRLLLRRGIIIGVLIVDLGIVDACPGRLAHGLPALKGFQPPGQHPLRLALLCRNKTDGIFRQALRGLFGFDIGDESVFILVNVDLSDLIDGLLYGRHSSLRSRFQGPRVGFVGYGRFAIALRSSLWWRGQAAKSEFKRALEPEFSCVLSNDELTFIKASSRFSTSWSEVAQPRLMRSEPRASSGSTPIAASTVD